MVPSYRSAHLLDLAPVQPAPVAPINHQLVRETQSVVNRDKLVLRRTPQQPSRPTTSSTAVRQAAAPVAALSAVRLHRRAGRDSRRPGRRHRQAEVAVGASVSDVASASPVPRAFRKARAAAGPAAHENVHAVPVAVNKTHVKKGNLLHLSRRKPRRGYVLHNLSHKGQEVPTEWKGGLPVSQSNYCCCLVLGPVCALQQSILSQEAFTKGGEGMMVLGRCNAPQQQKCQVRSSRGGDHILAARRSTAVAED